MSITLHRRTSGPIEIVTLSGRLVLGDPCSNLRETIRSTSAQPTDVLVDLSGVSYIDSAGLGELVACFNAVTTSGRQMKLLRPTKRVDSMLHITKLYSTFEIFEEESVALASFIPPLGPTQ